MPGQLVDAVDFKVLSRLQQFGRDSWKRLGELLGLTPQATADRVRRLEQTGVIQGYAAVVDPDAVGIHTLAFVAVSLERPRNREQFLSRVASLTEVQECHHVSGDFDYLLKIRCRNTFDLERLIGEEIKGQGGVGASRTIVALRTVKETTILPLVTGPVQG